jgi:hypothetical protein
VAQENSILIIGTEFKPYLVGDIGTVLQKKSPPSRVGVSRANGN